jgi:glycosyltransferase involved in cell wall biosynthesis
LLEPTVSIALATYNGARFLRWQLEDLAGQTHKPVELIVSDDGSEDETLAIVERFAREAPFPVRIYQNGSRLGYRRNFLNAVAHCTSDLVAFCDQDDRWDLRKLEIAVQPFEAPEVLLVYHNAEVVSSDRTLVSMLDNMSPAAYRPLQLAPYSWTHGFRQVFRRSLATLSDCWSLSLDHFNQNEPLAHDQWFFFLASVLGIVEYLPAPLAQYRQHDCNTFGWIRPTGSFDALLALKDTAATYTGLARAASARALALECAERSLTGGKRDRAHRGAAAYQELASRFSVRGELYATRSLGRRLRIVGSLLAQDAYASDSWCFGRRGLLKDIGIGLPGIILPLTNTDASMPIK